MTVQHADHALGRGGSSWRAAHSRCRSQLDSTDDEQRSSCWGAVGSHCAASPTGSGSFPSDVRWQQRHAELGAGQGDVPSSRLSLRSPWHTEVEPPDFDRFHSSWLAVKSHCQPVISDSEADYEELIRVELTKNCYNLAVVCSHKHFVPLTLVLATSAFQVAALYIVVCASPEYHFGNGAWLQPFNGQYTLLIMKVIALVLNTFQATMEFEDIGQTVRVLTHTPPLPMGAYRRYMCAFVLSIQYVFSAFVQVAGAHLVLSVDYPLKALWISYYVYLTLNFDNLLCHFFLYLGGTATAYQWALEMRRPRSEAERRVAARTQSWTRRLFVWLPVLLGLSSALFAFASNSLPLTVFRYGFVTNARPVLMLDPSLKLPGGCCGVQTWEASDAVNGSAAASGGLGGHLHASVPCLSQTAPEEAAAAAAAADTAIVHWVLWPSRSVAPSSLQVLDARAQAGSRIQFSGAVVARPVPARQWLFRPELEIEPEAADSIYSALITDGADGGTVGLYRHSFFYAADFALEGVPWLNDHIIYAIALNPRTGALSPAPVASKILQGSTCPKHCEHCDQNRRCLKCDEGYVRRGRHGECKKCGPHCKKCIRPNTCDPQGCHAGYGFDAGLCLPCAGSDCESCDTEGAGGGGQPESEGAVPGGTTGGDRPQTVDRVQPRGPVARAGTEGQLPCRHCAVGFGLQSNGTCAQCLTPWCRRCQPLDRCLECPPGSLSVPQPPPAVLSPAAALAGLDAGTGTPFFSAAALVVADECRFCAEHCLACDQAGEGRCDPGGCEVGFRWLPEGACAACPENCLDCTDGHCSPGNCAKGFGLEDRRLLFGAFSSPRCVLCRSPHCDACDGNINACDRCSVGYGITPRGSCDDCAPHCSRCNLAGGCDECSEGYISVGSVCEACGDQCLRCDQAGPSRCDAGACAAGWTSVLVAAAAASGLSQGNVLRTGVRSPSWSPSLSPSLSLAL